MTALMPLFALVFLGVMGWVLMRLIGGPGSPETFNPNSCASCSTKQGGASASQSQSQARFAQFRVAPAPHRLRFPR